MLNAFMPVLAAARAKVTPVPGVGEQMANEVKDTVSQAAATAGSILDRMPLLASRLLMSLAILIAGLILLKVGKWIIARFAHRKNRTGGIGPRKGETARSIISSIYSYIMFFAIVASILWVFNVNVTSILAAAGVVGVAIAFGAQTLVKDILAGLFIWGEGSIAVGDLVSINDMSGTVEVITIRTTTIRNYNGNLCTIPNGDIRAITNMSRGFKRAVVNIPCPYEEDQERIVAMIKDEMKIAAQEVDGIESVPDVMSIVAFEKNAVMLQISVACPVGEHWRIEREIRSRVKACFDREGIMMPHYTHPEP